MKKRRKWMVGEQASNVLAIYRPTERLEGGEVTAQLWREDFDTEEDWRAAAELVRNALNQLGEPVPAPDFRPIGVLHGTDDGGYRVQTDRDTDLEAYRTARVYVRLGP